MKLDILVFAAHPDDAELSCAGTIMSHIQQGKKVGIVDLTRGELGTRGTAATRYDEAAAASKILGIDIRENLGFADGFFQNDNLHKLAVIKKIRQYQPEIILANAIHDRHPDHGKGAKLVAESCFLAGLIKIVTLDENGQTQAPWRPKAVYHYIQDTYIAPDFVVDITPFMEQKEAAIKAFKTQFHDPKSGEPSTYISSSSYLDAVKSRATDIGKQVGFRYAEGFTKTRIIGVTNLFDLK
ncbi:MAG: bacillithiol biosynthesis deacetylase BshB1 [Chitinophagales bacterium]